MIIIGERINASRDVVKEALIRKDSAFFRKEAALQLEAGCRFLDINCGLSRDNEAEDMGWLISTIQEAYNTPLSIDSPDPEVIKSAAGLVKEKVLINSITLERSRYEKILPVAQANRASVIALTMDEKGMPETADDRVRIAEKLLKITSDSGIPAEDVYFDPLIRPISSEPKQALETLSAIARIKSLGNVKVVCGISNVSYGLPRRSVINSAFFSMALAAGMDAALIDPLDRHMMASVRASEAILCKDRYCMNFIQSHRKGLI